MGVRLSDVKGGTEIRRFREDTDDPIIGLVFTPDGRRALFSDLNGVLYLWDLENKKEIRRFEP